MSITLIDKGQASTPRLRLIGIEFKVREDGILAGLGNCDIHGNKPSGRQRNLDVSQQAIGAAGKMSAPSHITPPHDIKPPILRLSFNGLVAPHR
jgi:hypothetical protein